MSGRTSLVEQKRLQWAREREEMARLCSQWGSYKLNPIRTTIRTYPSSTRMSLMETNNKEPPCVSMREGGHGGSAINLKYLGTENFGNEIVDLQNLNRTGGSLVNLNDHGGIPQIMRRRSPSLPPIYSKEQREPGVEGSHYYPQPQKHQHHQIILQNNPRRRYSSPREEREGETSGYGSDSVEVPLGFLPGCKFSDIKMSENTWQNSKNYYGTPESSLPPSRKLSATKGELNRPRWGSIWGQELIKGDPPPPSWLERGLSRLDQTSQVLVINHDSTSSPDSSTTGSAGSDSTKTHLRGQNIPVDADVLQEREVKRQKALELQNAIKQQLEERDRQRKDEKERRMQEEREEEKRIKRERNKEKERFEEEQRKLREKEDAKQKQAEAMRKVLEVAERLAKEEKKLRRKREDTLNNSIDESRSCKETNVDLYKPLLSKDDCLGDSSRRQTFNDLPIGSNHYNSETKYDKGIKQINNQRESDFGKEKDNNPQKNSEESNSLNAIQLPISKDIAIVLSGRLEDSEIINTANLQLVNLVVTPSPRVAENRLNNLTPGLHTLMQSLGSSGLHKSSTKSITSPRIVENRLLTPSKYRVINGRDFGTQTNVEQDLQDLQDNVMKEVSVKERKEAVNTNRRDVERFISLGLSSVFHRSTNTGLAEELSMKTFSRSKSQPRTSLESRPRWNANRPGTRYRTQSEKDPHYQRRLRLRRRQVESSDERSRSSSLDRRKPINSKSKTRNSTRRTKVKLDSYDADLSMDSLNSIIPLRIDKSGRINIENNKDERGSGSEHTNEKSKSKIAKENNTNLDTWCGREVLSQLTTLRNGLLMKQREWDLHGCLVSPTPEFY